jgi:hypothetical protein
MESLKQMDELYASSLYFDDDQDLFPSFLDEEERCDHRDRVFIDGSDIQICRDCGEEIKVALFNAEFSGSSKNNFTHSKYVAKRPPKSKAIEKILLEHNIDLCNMVIDQITEIYQGLMEYQKGVPIKGSNRRGVIAASIYVLNYDMGISCTPSEVCDMLDITKHDFSEGLTKVKNAYKRYATLHIEPEDLVYNFLINCKIDLKHMDNIVTIITKVKNMSSIIKTRSCPKSIAAGIIYLYMTMLKERGYTDFPYSKSEFSKMVNLAEITITKISKEAKRFIFSNK